MKFLAKLLIGIILGFIIFFCVDLACGCHPTPDFETPKYKILVRLDGVDYSPGDIDRAIDHWITILQLNNVKGWDEVENAIGGMYLYIQDELIENSITGYEKGTRFAGVYRAWDNSLQLYAPYCLGGSAIFHELSHFHLSKIVSWDHGDPLHKNCSFFGDYARYVHEYHKCDEHPIGYTDQATAVYRDLDPDCWPSCCPNGCKEGQGDCPADCY